MAGPFGLSLPSPGTVSQRRDSDSPPAISCQSALACVAPSVGQEAGATGLCIACGTPLVLDSVENLLPMHCDLLRCIHSNSNVGAVYTEDRDDDVRTNPNNFANASRQYQHVSLHACLEMTTIPPHPRVPTCVSDSRQCCPPCLPFVLRALAR
jgi:hypothetical protein